jgi:hypothetical protein
MASLTERDVLVFGLMALTVGSLVAAGYFLSENQNLSLEKETLDKPIILTTPMRILGGTQQVSFPFYVKNPSNKYYYIDLSSGSCLARSAYIKKTRDENVLGGEVSSEGDITVKRVDSTKMIAVQPHGQITLYCSSFDVINPPQNTTGELRVCLKEKKTPTPICESIDIAITKR